MSRLVRSRVLGALLGLVLVASATPAQAQEGTDSDGESSSERTDRSDAYESLSDREEEVDETDLQNAKLAMAATGGMHAKLGSQNARLRKIVERLEDEPSIDEVQEAALEFYGLEHGQIRKYERQANSKSIVPKISAQYRKNLVDSDVTKFDYAQFSPDEPAGLDQIDGGIDEFVVAGTWNLPKLIYNPEVLELASLRKTRERVLKEVTRLYFLRRRLKISFLLDPPSDASTKVRKQIRIDQTTAMINAMTDGIFEKSDDDD